MFTEKLTDVRFSLVSFGFRGPTSYVRNGWVRMKQTGDVEGKKNRNNMTNRAWAVL